MCLLLAMTGAVGADRRAVAGQPRIGRADLAYIPSFSTAAHRTARRHGVLDGAVEGRFAPDGSRLTAAFVRLEVTSRWPVVTGSDVRDNSGYRIYLVRGEEAASGASVAARLRMGDSSYRIAPPREILAPLVGSPDRALLDRLPDLPALSAVDLDGDGVDEILVFFRRQLAMSARPEGRLHVLRIEGRAVVDAVSIPVIVPDVSEDFDFWGYLVAEIKIERGASGAAATIAVTYARTSDAEDQRADAAPPRAMTARSYTLASPARAIP